MRRLLIIAALGEACTGLFLFVYSSLAMRLFLGITIDDAAIEMSRLAGISLMALGVACWPDSNTRRGFYGMFTYSTIVMVFFVSLGIGGRVGILLWPAVAIHACLSSLLVWERRKEINLPWKQMTEGPANKK